VVSASNGALVNTILYAPYGSTRSGDVPTDRKLTGQRLDGTGLYYYGARYYDPTIGRFISADNVLPNYANPQALNRYTYVLNNPLKYFDPSGSIVEIPFPLEPDYESYGVAMDPSVFTNWPELVEAYDLLGQVAPEITRTLEESSVVFQLRSFDIGSLLGYTESTRGNIGSPVQIVVNPTTTKSTKSMAWVLFHEFIHGAIIDQTWGAGMLLNGSSRYEEAIAFQFQHSVGQKLGFDPGPHQPWSFMWRSSEQSASEIVRKSLWVDLSVPPEALRDKLNRALRDTSYRLTRPLPPAEYFGIMNSMINAFIR
jgi:RHS repeat-associated protein